MMLRGRGGKRSVTTDPDLLRKHLAGISEAKLHEQTPVVCLLCFSRAQRYASKILSIPGFENIMGALILMNLVAMIIEIDHSTNEDMVHSDRGMHWTEMFGWVILAMFTIELTLRLLALQVSFWRDAWNIGDFLIVSTDLVFSVVELLAGNAFPVSVLRIFRLSKLARVSKLLRVFPELRMLLVGLVRSFKATFWGTLLLLLFLLVWSMVGVLLIHPLNKTIDHGDCYRCERAYSSVMQALLTLWQQIVAGDSWGQVTIPLMENYPITALFFIPTFLSIGFCAMNLMLAVVVTVSQMAYEEEEEKEETERTLSSLRRHSDILELCKAMDTDNSGELSYEEIYSGYQQPGKFRDSLLSLDIIDEDLEIAWTLMDVDRSGSISYKEFVTFLFSMKGSDENFLLTYIKYYVTWIKDSLAKQVDAQHAETKEIENRLEETMEKIKGEEGTILEDVDRILSNSKQEGVQEPSISNLDGLTPSVAEMASTRQQHVNTDACVDKGVVLASVRVATEDLMKEFSNDARWQHLDLKDILANLERNILANMQRNISQRLPSSGGFRTPPPSSQFFTPFS